MSRVFSAADIEKFVAAGQRVLVIDPGAIVSPLATDRARDLGVEIRRGRGDPDAPPGIHPGSMPAIEDEVRRTLRAVLDEGDSGDVRDVVRRTLQRLRASRDVGTSRSAEDLAQPLAGRVAVVTGAASGIGRATAVELARAGAAVALGSYAGDPHDVTDALREVEAVGGNAIVVHADVRRPREVDDLCARAVREWGRLDVAVANAGVLQRHRIEALTDESWQQVLEVNLGGVMRTCRSAVEHMGSGGSIVAVSSIAGGVLGWAEHAHYAAAKAGIGGLVRSLAVELGPRSIRVNAVLPGLIETPQSLDEATSVGAVGLSAAAGALPLRRIGAPEDVATVIRFLATEGAGYLTGQAVVVDGGLSTALAL